MAQVITFIFSFFLGYTASHYTLTSWGLKAPLVIVLGMVFGILVAFFATLAVAPLLPL